MARRLTGRKYPSICFFSVAFLVLAALALPACSGGSGGSGVSGAGSGSGLTAASFSQAQIQNLNSQLNSLNNYKLMSADVQTLSKSNLLASGDQAAIAPLVSN